MTISIAKTNDTRSIFSHWAWAVLALLFASSMTIYQIDLVPPSIDEWWTIYSAGWLEDTAMTPTEILQSLVETNIANTPGYNLLLSAWGNLTTLKIATARYLSVLLYLLILAFAYRLARDFVAPVAGLFALVIVFSNAFFNFYIADARPYTLFVLLSCLTIWLYLRIIHRRLEPTAIDLLALFAAVFALVMTHLFSATLLFSLGIYHLLFVSKDRRWLWVSLAVIIAVLLCMPLVAIVLTRYSTAYYHLGPLRLNGIETVTTWLSFMLNSQPVLLSLIVGAGLYFSKRKGLIRLQPWLVLPALFLITLGLLGEFTPLIRIQTMRHQLDGWALLVLFAAAGHYALFRRKQWLGILITVWLFAGIFTQQATNWWTYASLRTAAFWYPPTQALSKLALEEAVKPDLIGYPYETLYSRSLFADSWLGVNFPISQSRYYFSQHGIEIAVAHEADEFVEFTKRNALRSPKLWYFHRAYLTDSAEADLAKAELRRLNYEWCGVQKIGVNTIVNQYMWRLLDCKPPSNPASFTNDLINYELYNVGLDGDADTVLFIDRWTPRQHFDRRSYNMSYQLINADWDNVAQLDLPMAHEADLRQFSLDASQVPPGQYRLMLILYNTASSDRLTWDGNEGYVPEMLPLGEITVGEP